MGHIAVNNIGKAYKRYPNRWSRLLEWVDPTDRPRHQAHWVLRGVSFEVATGETVGIVGQNGAGKSTLLKIIVGTTHPTEGRVEIGGRVGALLELGMGFHPDFTGRQNCYTAGQLLGLRSEEIVELMPQIEAFAEIGDYFDQPVRTYSSGMQVRVAFSVATVVKPSLLIVDEALSVGDSYFQHKSFDRIRQFRDEGVSIIFVSHSMDVVRTLCDRVILLHEGRVLKDGQPDEVVDYYNAFIAEKENAKVTIEQRRKKDGWLLTKSGTGEACVKSLRLLDVASGNELAIVQVGQAVELRLEASIHADIPRLVLGYMIRDKQGHVVWGTNTWHTHQIQEDIKSGEVVVFSLLFTCTLGPGSYSVTPALVSSDTHLINNYEWVDHMFVFDVVNMGRDVFIGTNWLDAQFSISRQIEGYTL